MKRQDALDELPALACQDDPHDTPIAFVVLPARKAVALETVDDTRQVPRRHQQEVAQLSECKSRALGSAQFGEYIELRQLQSPGLDRPARLPHQQIADA